MLNNPLSQIERTKDAYMGRPQELQKRANMTKELVDLLAMQQLKKDLDAVKRNQAMQAQGTPATIKEQMQQGLMGEYRQQAAKDMGVGPSEMDTVNRARQGMPQGGPRMPQGAPQQMPQQAQGVMSQARPVQLAGGGIVAFANGSENEGPVEVTEDQIQALQQRLGRTIDRNRAIEMIRSNPEGKSAIERLFSALGPEGFTPERIKRRQRSEIGEEPSAEIDDGAEAGLASTAQPNLYPPKDDSFAPTNEEVAARRAKEKEAIIARAVEEKQSAEEAPLSGLAAITKAQTDLFTKDMPEFKPPAPSEKLRGAIDEGIMSLDDARAESTKREERALELMGMGPDGQSRKDFEEQLAGLAALRDKNAETQRRRDLIEFLGAGFSQGAEKYVEQEDARRARDAKYLTDRKAIQNTRMELQKVAGQEAVDSYDNALQSYLTTRSNAVRDLSNLEGQDREDYRASYNAGMNNRQMQADILASLSANEQNALSRIISGRNADANILQVAFAGLDKQQAAIESAKLTEIQRIVGPEIAQTVALNGTLTDEENAAYAAAQVKVQQQFAEREAAIATLREDALKKVSQSVTGEEVRGSSDFDKYQD
jgi:hypothetical protein